MTDRYPEINETIRYIHQHLHEPLSLSELACYASYSNLIVSVDESFSSEST